MFSFNTLTAAVVSLGLVSGLAVKDTQAAETVAWNDFVMPSSASLEDSLLTNAVAEADDLALAQAGSSIKRVQRYIYRDRRYRDRRYRDRRRGLRGRDVGIGIGAAIIGGMIASQAARADRTAMQMCADRFRSFDWERGTYVTYGGEVRVCPYLR